MNPLRYRRVAAIAFLSCLAFPSAAAPFAAELYSGAAWGSVNGPFLEARAAASAEAYGPVFSAYVSGDGAASLTLPGAIASLSTGALAELSAAGRAFTAVLRLEGGYDAGALYVDGGGDLWTTKATASFCVNGFPVSASLAPRAAWSSGTEGRTELGARLGISATAGSFVLKPGADAAWSQWADGSRSIEIRPGLGLSWYPGFPLSFQAEAGYRRTWLVSGATTDEFPAAFSLFGAAGNRLLYKAGVDALWDINSGAFAEARARGEVSFRVGRIGRGELRLPLGLAWDMDATKGFSVGMGLSMRLD